MTIWNIVFKRIPAMSYEQRIFTFIIFWKVFIPYSVNAEPINRFGNHTSNCTEVLYEEYWTVDNFPSPETDIDLDYCGRSCKPSAVCDPYRIINQEQADFIDNLIEEISREVCLCSSCPKKRQSYIAVGLVQTLNGTQNYSTEGSTFPDDLLQKWGLGTCGDGILIFTSIYEKRIWISSGPKIQSLLTEDCVMRLQTEWEPLYRQAKYGEALILVTERLRLVLKEKTCFPSVPLEKQEQEMPSEAIIGGVGVFVILVIYGGYMLRVDHLRKMRKEEPFKKKRKKKNFTLIIRRNSSRSSRSRLSSQLEKKPSLAPGLKSTEHNSTLDDTKEEHIENDVFVDEKEPLNKDQCDHGIRIYLNDDLDVTDKEKRETKETLHDVPLIRQNVQVHVHE